MKQLFSFFSLLLLTLGMAACDVSSENEHHEISFFPLSPNGRLLYADQTFDTLRVVSTETWHIAARVGQGEAWFSLTPKEQKVPKGYVSGQRVDITTTANTTGKTRKGYLALTPLHANLGTLGMPVTQYAWLDIQRPAPVMPPHANIPTFAGEVEAKVTEATIGFGLHTLDLKTVSLTSNAEWCLVPQMAEGWKKGYNEVKLSLTPNLSTTPRTATLTLSSGGVSNVITLVQKGAKP